MKFNDLLSDDAVLAELGHRIAEARLALGMTQAQLAQAAGVSKRTLERLEDGASAQLGNLVRCLRALGKLEGLERLLPETPANPIELLRGAGTPRSRARPAKGASPAPRWTWGDEK